MRLYKIALLLALLVTMSCSKKNADTPKPDETPWDGRYMVEGAVTDYHEPQIVYAGPQEYSLIPTTGGKNEVLCKKLGINGHLINWGTSLTYYGTFGLIITIDPVSFKITSISNSYGQPSASGRSAVLDPSGINTFDPDTKNLKIKYWMDEVGITGHRTAFTETWTYIGAR